MFFVEIDRVFLLAIKMPGKQVAENIRKLIIEAKQRKEKIADIAKRYHVSERTVKGLWKRWKEDGTVKRRRGSGRPRKTTIREARILVRQVKKDPFMTAVELAKYAQEHHNLNISEWTARRLLAHEGLKARTPAKKPLISKKNRKDRVAFAKAHEKWTVRQWARILFSDESKKNLFGSDGIRFVRRPANKRFNKKYILPTVKHSASVLPWGNVLF